MSYLIVGKFISILVYLIFSKLTINYNYLSFIESIFGWFFLEHVFENFKDTPGKCFVTSHDFRNFTKSLVIIISQKILINFLIFFLLFIFYFSNLKNKIIKIVIYLSFICCFFKTCFDIRILLNFFDNLFIFQFYLFIYLCIYFIILYNFIVYKLISFGFKLFFNTNSIFKVTNLKIRLYFFTVLICNIVFFVSLYLMCYLNNNFIQEFTLKILIVYTYLYYYLFSN